MSKCRFSDLAPYLCDVSRRVTEARLAPSQMNEFAFFIDKGAGARRHQSWIDPATGTLTPRYFDNGKWSDPSASKQADPEAGVSSPG